MDRLIVRELSNYPRPQRYFEQHGAGRAGMLMTSESEPQTVVFCFLLVKPQGDRRAKDVRHAARHPSR